MVFLFDFENVANRGFDGLDKLGEGDRLIIFYSETSSNISLGVHQKLELSKAKKEYFSVKTGGKNALDFQLSTYLGYLIANNVDEEYCIVSKDEGYRFVVDFWKNKTLKIIRCSNLLKETKDSIKSEINKLLPSYPSEVDKIEEILGKYKTKQGINNALVKEFGSEITRNIYKSLRPLIKDKK